MRCKGRTYNGRHRCTRDAVINGLCIRCYGMKLNKEGKKNKKQPIKLRINNTNDIFEVSRHKRRLDMWKKIE